MCQRQTILSNTPKHVVAATGCVYMRSLLLLLSIKFAILQWHFDRTNQTGLCLLSLTMCHIVSQCNFIALEKSVDRDEYNAPYITIKPMTFSIAWRFAVFTWHFIHCLVFEKKNPRYPAFTEQVLVVRTDPFCVYVCMRMSSDEKCRTKKKHIIKLNAIICKFLTFTELLSPKYFPTHFGV